MVRVKMLSGNETCIIDNGKSYIFGLNGQCYKEDAGNLSTYMIGALALPVISLLSSLDNFEVGVQVNDTFKVYKSDLDIMTSMMLLNKKGNFLKMLRRSGTCSGKTFNQMFFVYSQVVDLDDILKVLSLREEIKYD